MGFWEYFFENNLFINYLAEFMAVLSGIIYLIKVKPAPYGYSYFVQYLCIILIVELVGLYSLIAYLSDYKYFSFTEDSLFRRNFWLYNSFLIIESTVLFLFFKTQIETIKFKRLILLYIYLYIPVCILSVLSFDNFFHAYSNVIFLGSCFGVMTCVCLYFLELIRTDRILNFHLSLTFYVSILLLVWNLTITPLFIYSEFITSDNPEFTKVYYAILRHGNLILYMGFTAAFYIDYNSRKHLEFKNS